MFSSHRIINFNTYDSQHTSKLLLLYIKIIPLKFEFVVLTAICMNSIIFQDVTLCNLIEIHRCFGGIQFLHLHGRRLRQARSRWQANKCYIPGDNTLDYHQMFGYYFILLYSEMLMVCNLLSACWSYIWFYALVTLDSFQEGKGHFENLLADLCLSCLRIFVCIALEYSEQKNTIF